MSDLNPLFPIFLKANQLKVLIVGGGYVALEKLTSLWNNSLEAEVKLVAPEINNEIKQLLDSNKKIELMWYTQPIRILIMSQRMKSS